MPRKPQKDRTSLIISVVAHAVVIAGILFWAYKTGRLEQMRQAVLQYVKGEKKEEKKAEPIQQKQAAAPKLPPINQGMKAPESAGTRRAVASDAPEAAGGGSFFQDTRRQVEGPSTSGASLQTRTNVPVQVTPRATPFRPAMESKVPSTIKQLLVERAKAVASVESVGAEQISKSGVSDAGGAVTKVAGATIVEGKFAVIRGLSDRYVSTTLNGANLPSADPYRQSAPLDLFPSQVIEKVVVSKTFTPDQPGSFTGGGVEIVTKSFPERPFLAMSLGGNYNSQANLNDTYLTYNGGRMDWAALDDGTRALPEVFNTEAPISSDPKKTPAIPPIRQISLATNSADFARVVINDQLVRALGPTEFAPHQDAPPLGHNFSIAGGDSLYFLGRPLGLFASGSYKHDYSSYQDGISARYEAGVPGSGRSQLKNYYQDSRSLSTANWSTMANLAYKLFPDHELDFVFFYNQNSVDDARIQIGKETYVGDEATFRKFNLYWTERNLNTLQFKGKHDFPELAGLHFDWLVGLTQTTQDEPDARFFNDVTTGGGYTTDSGSIPAPNKPTRYFRNLGENNQNVKLDWTLPFRNWTEEEGKFKFGLFDSSSTRDFTERQAYYTFGVRANGSSYNNDPNQFLTEQNLGATFTTNANKTVRAQFARYVQGFESVYTGNNDIQAGYFMLELPVLPLLRLIGGARYETTDFSVFSASYLNSSVTRTNINNALIKQSDLLPSAGLIYALRPDMNLRMSYSQTVARPSYRELAAYYGYDPVVNEFVEGNPELKMTSAKNYDARWEWFPRPGELISFTLFYKDLVDAIERGNLDQQGEVISFFNNDAKLYGVELEARKNLDFLGAYFRPFSLGGNLSLIQSQVKLSPQDLQNKRAFFPDASDTRPLYDQSPYVLNLDLNYENREFGTSASMILNVSGARIVFAKINTEDVYEQPAPTLDFVLSQKLGCNKSLKFTAKNILDPSFERTYGTGNSLVYSSYKKGRTYGLSFSYDF